MWPGVEAMGPRLLRFTTRYVATEDRICLTGLASDETPVSLWLTARGLGRLLPRLLDWLGAGSAAVAAEASPRLRLQNELNQASAQQRALALRTATKPVLAPAGDVAPWLVRSFSLSPGRSLTIVMRGNEGEAASLRFDPVALRQWLAILCRLYRRAGWALDAWPPWLLESTEPAPRQAVLH